MQKKTNKYLISAILIGVAFHGVSIFFTLETTYDALIHLFFGEHYANNWFEPWSYKWYTGFTVMGYPPLVHQSIGLFSLIGGLKFGLFTVAIIGILLFITGAYRFSLLITGNRNAAGYAAIFAVVSSSFVETLHIFGQLPSIMGVSVLMHALPEIYLWIKTGKRKYLGTSLSLLAVTITSHHVTPIFGMVFFIFPLFGMAVMDIAYEEVKSYEAIRFSTFLKTFFNVFKRILSFGLSSLVLFVFCILPYWINTKNNPITQVPIPHGSRDNFLEVTSSGLVFFIIPWGMLLFVLPYLFYRFYAKRYLLFGMSFTMLTILGTGGTTPIPKMILGDNAFNILTLDRFTLWASIMALPIFGEFLYRFIEKDLKSLLQKKYGAVQHRVIGAFLISGILTVFILSVNLGYFKPSQPQKIKMLPIINFLHQDQHDHWRFLPLGFGDQMAWLSAQTNAMTVDGNYHSARRLPELTTRAVERLENSKFRGIEGLGSLQQFLTVPEKYNLKYVFSNDKFYDPVLYFCGWQRLRQLENGIIVWEKLNIKPLSSILPKDDVPRFQKILWGTIPVGTVVVVFLVFFRNIWRRVFKTKKVQKLDYLKHSIVYDKFNKKLIPILFIWISICLCFFLLGTYKFYIANATQISPKNLIYAYYDALDFKEFERAYSFLNPESNKTKDQFMLEIAVNDGLLSSYAKLDEIRTTLLSRNDTMAKAKVETFWITPLERIEKTYFHELKKLEGDWFINPLEYDLDIPPDQLFSTNKTQFYNHGRRRITSEQTHHEDVLKQPVLEVLSSRLIEFEGKYSIVGEIQNVDDVPADVVINGSLYNKENTLLASYNVMHQMKHKLLPKEVSSFKMNFEGVAWSNQKEEGPKTFNPKEFTDIDIKDIPSVFELQCAGNVATKDLYKSLVLQELNIEERKISGTLFNAGLQEVTIPQLLFSYYNENKELIWVDHYFVPEGVRQQRKLFFSTYLPDISNIKSIAANTENAFVNGLPNRTINEKVDLGVIHEKNTESFIPIKGCGFSYLKIELNSYIGAPN